ncbi:NB-ARC domain-containing protein [Streptomyces sp. NPDC049954]|uniref:NB-ARC domain-containing protein n=1 Tax=Streptomyces sp. NPDC049954 TaxID=3155779 RepID=UPI003449B97C
MPLSSSRDAGALHRAVARWQHQPRSPAWHELADIVLPLCARDEALAQLWRQAPTGPAFSAALDASAALDPKTGHRLDSWLERYAAPTTPPPHGNAVSGSVLNGPTVQSGTIHGGVHFHATSPASSSPRPVPRQLPPTRNWLADRRGDLRALDRLGGGEHPVLLVVSGFAGVGKTTLVARWLKDRTDHYPDGQLYADLGGHRADGRDGPVAPAAVLSAFLRALGATAVPDEFSERVTLWRSLTWELRLILMLDNVATSAQVRPLLPGSSTGLTVVTSRRRLTGLAPDGALTHHLRPLPPEAAVELLATGGGARVAREPVAAREVVTLCAGLPLAVCLAAAQLAARPQRTVSALARTLAQGGGPLGALSVDGEAVVHTALDLAYASLPEQAAALYRGLGALPPERFELSLLTALCGTGSGPEAARQAEFAVNALLEAHLLEETGPGVHRFHDLVRPHAAERGEAANEDERERCAHRFVRWCLAGAAEAERLLTPSHRRPGNVEAPESVACTPLDGAPQAVGWLSDHGPALLEAVRLAHAAGWDALCWQLVDATWPYFQRLRPAGVWSEAHRLGLHAAERAGARPGVARMLTSGAVGLREEGRYEEAGDWYRRALELARADGDPKEQAQAHNGLGHLAMLTGRYTEAREQLGRGLALRESVGYHRGAALSRVRLGEVALAEGAHEDAVRELARARTELTGLDETYEAARACALMGRATALRGEPDAGSRLVEEALGVFVAAGTRSPHWEGTCLVWLGDIAEQQGDRERARDRLAAAQAVLRLLDPAKAERIGERLGDGPGTVA